jgi:hypothetical protein
MTTIVQIQQNIQDEIDAKFNVPHQDIQEDIQDISDKLESIKFDNGYFSNPYKNKNLNKSTWYGLGDGTFNCHDQKIEENKEEKIGRLYEDDTPYLYSLEPVLFDTMNLAKGCRISLSINMYLDFSVVQQDKPFVYIGLGSSNFKYILKINKNDLSISKIGYWDGSTSYISFDSSNVTDVTGSFTQLPNKMLNLCLCFDKTQDGVGDTGPDLLIPTIFRGLPKVRFFVNMTEIHSHTDNYMFDDLTTFTNKDQSNRKIDIILNGNIEEYAVGNENITNESFLKIISIDRNLYRMGKPRV